MIDPEMLERLGKHAANNAKNWERLLAETTDEDAARRYEANWGRCSAAAWNLLQAAELLRPLPLHESPEAE